MSFRPPRPIASRSPTPRGRPHVRFLVKHFLRGLLVVVPAAATIWIVVQLFVVVDGFLRFPFEPWTVPIVGWEVPAIPWRVPGIGVLLTFALITVVGLATANIVTRKLLRLGELVFMRMPLVNLLYTSIRDFVEAFVSDKKKFDKPVLLSLGEGMDTDVIGFVTRDSLDDFGLQDRVAVYVPQSYNFAANLLLVPRHRVRPIDKPATEVMAFVVSGGVARSSNSDPVR